MFARRTLDERLMPSGQVPPCSQSVSFVRLTLKLAVEPNLPKLVFDSRRGVTLETFSCRNEHSGLGAGIGQSDLVDLARLNGSKP